MKTNTIPHVDSLDIAATAAAIHARTQNPVSLPALQAILRNFIALLRARAAKYPEDTWGIVETATGFEVTPDPEAHGLVLCVIPAVKDSLTVAHLPPA